MDRASTAILEKCEQELLALAPHAALLNMTPVSNIKAEAYRSFAMLGKALKLARIPFRYAGLDSTLRKILVNDGLLSHNEANETLETAAKDLFELISHPKSG
ncbi:MAG: hypothetical protein ACXWQO_17300, partial [Bdellovibrionota bacterium]